MAWRVCRGQTEVARSDDAVTALRILSLLAGEKGAIRLGRMLVWYVPADGDPMSPEYPEPLEHAADLMAQRAFPLTGKTKVLTDK